jgi:hypothetical protein
VCPKSSHFWVIKTNPYDHTCVQEVTRSDHTQLKRELAEDMTLTIKIICVLLKANFSGVNPSYSKIWRGHDEAIAQKFGSLDGSYGILT